MSILFSSDIELYSIMHRQRQHPFRCYESLPYILLAVLILLFAGMWHVIVTYSQEFARTGRHTQGMVQLKGPVVKHWIRPTQSSLIKPGDMISNTIHKGPLTSTSTDFLYCLDINSRNFMRWCYNSI